MGTTVATMPKEEGPKTFLQLIKRMAPAMESVLPKHLTPERMLTLVNLVANKTPKLKECMLTEGGRVSLFNAIMHASRLGLEVGHHAHLLPFKQKDDMVCVLVPDYRGLVDLARRSGLVNSIDTACVFEGDIFEYELGLAPRLVHKPSLKEVERNWGTVIAAYAIARLSDEKADPVFVVVPKWELKKVRDSSRAKDDGPWVAWYERMCQKTAVKRLCNLLPQSAELADAIELDTRGETGEIGRPIAGFDTPESLNEEVKDKTRARADDLATKLAAEREKRAASSDETEGNGKPPQTVAPSLRDAILTGLKDLSVPELHRRVKARLAELGYEQLKDVNALIARVKGVKSYQELQTAEDCADVLHAAQATEEEARSEGS